MKPFWRVATVGTVCTLGTYIWCDGISLNKPRKVEDYKEDMRRIKSHLDAYGAGERYVLPNDKFMVAVVGGVSAGKSALVNDYFGVTTKRSAAFEQDTTITVVETIPEKEFLALVSDTRIGDVVDVRSLPADRLREPIKFAGSVEDPRYGSLFIALQGSDALSRVISLHMFDDQDLLAGLRDGNRLHYVLINEAVYDNPAVFAEDIKNGAKYALPDAQRSSFPSRETRIAMATSSRLIDTPGLRASDRRLPSELPSILRQCDRTLFLVADPYSEETAFTMRVFMAAVARAVGQLEASVWQGKLLVLTQLDKHLSGDRTKEALCYELARTSASALLAGSEAGMRLPVIPTFDHVYTIGIPQEQTQVASPEGRIAHELPQLYNQIASNMRASETPDKRARSLLLEGLSLLRTHVARPSWGEVVSRWVPGAESSQQLVQALEAKYGDLLTAEYRHQWGLPKLSHLDGSGSTKTSPPPAARGVSGAENGQ